MRPRFSVVIPTRDRPNTLRFALRTCLAQDFEDYEIIVCDNCGSAGTRQLVEEVASPRVRYARSEHLRSMSSNWELAVSHARGEYVLVLGDDDGLLPHALRELDRIAAMTGARAIRWTGAFYLWPTITLPGQANYLRVPLGREVRTVEARSAIADAVAFRSCYSTLPMMYNSAVHQTVIGELRGQTGRVFASHYPDVYSGFALAWVAGTYVSTDVPMAVSGISGNSFGVATLYHRDKSPLDHEFRTLNSREALPTHRWVPDLPIFPFVPVADSFLLAKEHLFPGESSLCLDRRALAAHYVHGLRADNAAEWQAGLAVIGGTFKDDPESRSWFDATFGNHPFTPPTPVRLRSPHLGYDGDCLHLDTERFGVTDVAGAARLCESILGYGPDGVRYGLKRHSELQAESAAARTGHAYARQEAAGVRGELAALRQELALLRDRHAEYCSSFPHLLVERVCDLFRRRAPKTGKPGVPSGRAA
jgi:glycosyltransferase involved in cell wall biosynthesis